MYSSGSVAAIKMLIYVDTYSLEKSRVSIVADGSCILLLLRARTVRLVVYTVLETSPPSTIALPLLQMSCILIQQRLLERRPLSSEKSKPYRLLRP